MKLHIVKPWEDNKCILISGNPWPEQQLWSPLLSHLKFPTHYKWTSHCQRKCKRNGKKKEKKRKKGDCNVHTFVSSVLGSGKFRNFSVSLFQLAAFPRSEWITNFSCILITQIVSRRHLKIIYITNALLIYRHKTYPSIVLSTLWLFTSRKRWNLCKKSALEYV